MPGLGIRFIPVLPQLTPATELGAAAVAAYAERQGRYGRGRAGYRESLGPALTPGASARRSSDLIEGPAPGEGAEAYLVTAGGVRPAP